MEDVQGAYIHGRSFSADTLATKKVIFVLIFGFVGNNGDHRFHRRPCRRPRRMFSTKTTVDVCMYVGMLKKSPRPSPSSFPCYSPLLDPIHFPPTYKYAVGTDEYDTRNEKKVRIDRAPALLWSMSAPRAFLLCLLCWCRRS